MVVGYSGGGGPRNHLTPILAVIAGDYVTSSLVYASLLEFDSNTAAPKPGLAESFGISGDGTTVTFTLRDGLVWSDGSALTTDDVRFTVEAVMRSKLSPFQYSFEDIAGVDDYRTGKAQSISGIDVTGRNIAFHLTRPSCPALVNIGQIGILPQSVFGRYMDPADASRNIDYTPEDRAPPLASGPFKFNQWPDKQSLVLERNDLSYTGKPLLDQIVFNELPDQSAVLAALRAGESDLSHFALLSPSQRDDLKHMGNVDLHDARGLIFAYIAWNHLRDGKEFFRSKAVRQALAYGLNVNAVIDKLLAGEAVKMLAASHPRSWAYDPTGLNEYRYDRARAEDLLRQDGWTKGADGIYQKNGQRLAFTLTTWDAPDVKALQEEAVQQYQQIGVQVTPEIQEQIAFFNRETDSRDPVYGVQGGRDMDAWISRGVLSADPDDAYSTFHSSQIVEGFNKQGYRNPAVDRALEATRSQCGLAERKAAFHAVDLLLNDDQPILFAYAPNPYLVTSKRLQGVDPNPANVYANAQRWWVKQ
jgi:peptide/nickel transport system substrate-binding protein